MSNNEIFNAVCFSTNIEKFSSITIIKQYIMTANCNNVNYRNNNMVAFDHILSLDDNSKVTHTSFFYEMISFSKDNKVCDNSDCFIIFFDLEIETSIIELNKIITFIKCFSFEKKIVIIYFYNDENKICENYTEEKLDEILYDNNLNNFDSFKINIDSSDELNEAVDSITKDIFDSKEEKNSNHNNSESNSICFVF